MVGLAAAGIGSTAVLRNTLITNLETSLAETASTDVARDYIEVKTSGDDVEFERKPALMEIELIEPELFLGASALAADRFADVLQRRCAAGTEVGC